MSQPFDFNAVLKALQSGQKLTGKEGILTPLIKQLTEAALAAELDPHLAQDLEANRRNGTTKKTIRQQRHFRAVTGEEAPDHAGDEIEQKIIRMFALGMSYAGTSREIEAL